MQPMRGGEILCCSVLIALALFFLFLVGAIFMGHEAQRRADEERAEIEAQRKAGAAQSKEDAAQSIADAAHAEARKATRK